MAHRRTLIRNALKAILQADASIAALGVRVYAARSVPILQAELPAINITTPSESVDDDSHVSAPWQIDRDLSVEVECIVRGNDDAVVTAADTLAELVENAVMRDDTLSGTCGTTRMKGSEVVVDISGQLPVATVSISFVAVYDSTFPAEGTATLPDFDTAHTRWDLGGTHAVADEFLDSESNIHE